MNNHLSLLFRINDLAPEATMFVVNTVLAHDTESSSGRQERAYRRMHANMVSAGREVIREFTSRSGLINLDHIAWQLGVDTLEPLSGSDEPCDPCPIEGLIYLGHYVTPGRGASYKCSTCSKAWAKISDQYTETVLINA